MAVLHRRRRRPARSRLQIQQLESRQLLATIGGNVYHDLNENGQQSGDEPGLFGWSAYLDFNGNGALDDTRQSYESEDVDKPIQDQQTTFSTLLVSGVSGVVQDVDLHLDIQHRRVGDLTVTLISPAGTRRDLLMNYGEGQRNLTNNVLDDDAPEPITETNAPFTGRWRPQNSLSAFNGQSANGVWRLEVNDSGTNGLVGAIVNWSLDIANIRTERVSRTNIDGAYMFDGIDAGTYTVRVQRPAGWSQSIPSSGISVSVSANTETLDNHFGAYAQEGTNQINGLVWHDEDGNELRADHEPLLSAKSVYLDANNNGRFDSQPTEYFVDFGGTIPDGEESLESTLIIDDLTSPVIDVNLRFTIVHPFVEDIVAHLTSPAGTRVEMFARIGCCRNGGFFDTALDDEADVDVATWVTPFTGSFRPVEPLSRFDGEDGNGVWTFEVADVEAFDVGGLAEWALQISTLDSPGEPLSITDSQGEFTFDNVPAGTYPVRQILDEGWLQTFPADDASHPVTLTQDEVIDGLEFGTRPMGSAPTVLAVEFNTGLLDPPDRANETQPTSWQQQHSDLRSISITFSTPVSATASDLQLMNLGINAPTDDDVAIPLTDQHIDISGRTVTLRFDHYELPDGVYSLEVLATLTDATGIPLDGDGDGNAGDSFLLTGDEFNGFYKIAAELNGDRGVSIFDFPSLTYWFGVGVGPEGAPEYMDLNDDDGVSIFDFPSFVANFGIGVTFPSGLTNGSLGTLAWLPSPLDARRAGNSEAAAKSNEEPPEADRTHISPSNSFNSDLLSSRSPRSSERFLAGEHPQALDALLAELASWPGSF